MLLPIAGAQRTWKARHTANVEAKLADARRTLGIAGLPTVPNAQRLFTRGCRICGCPIVRGDRFGSDEGICEVCRRRSRPRATRLSSWLQRLGRAA